MIGSRLSGTLTSLAQLDYRSQKVSDLRTDRLKDFCTLTNRIWDVQNFAAGESRAERGEFREISSGRSNSAGFAQGEGSIKLPWSEFQHGITMRLRHCENKIGI